MTRNCSGARPFPWREAMAFGLGVLCLPPRDFWDMTPRELRAAVVGALPQRGAMVPLPRRDLDALMRRYPDVAPSTTHTKQPKSRFGV